MSKRPISLVLALLLPFSLSACGSSEDVSEARTVYTMDTVMNLTAYGENAAPALDAAEETLRALDAKLDRHSAASAVSALNRDGTAEDAELASLTEVALTVGACSEGAYDPTVAPLLDAWNFTGETPRVPSEAELQSLLAHVGLENVTVSGSRIALESGAQLDFGGIAKGYAGDTVRTVLAAHGVTSAVIDLGGDVGLLGTKPDGSDWRVAVKDPAEPSQFLGVLTAADTFIVTSGIYERGFEENGVRYHHILDPKTGRPAESGLTSVTVVCRDGAWADALSTACFVLGTDGALALRSALASDAAHRIELIFVTDDGRVLYTDGLSDCFTPSEEGSYVYEVLA